MTLIEELVYNFLNENMTVPVYTEIPSNPPKKMIVLEKTGSSQSNFIKQSTFAIQSYAKSLFEAAELNEQLKEIVMDGLDGLASLNEIVSVGLNSDYNYTDTTTKKYRYQAVFNIVHY